jgi:hypothetical protein
MRRARSRYVFASLVAVALAACRSSPFVWPDRPADPGAGAPNPVPGETYAFAPPAAAHDHGVPIDVERENRAASRAILRTIEEAPPGGPLIILPGFSVPGSTEPLELHPLARYRARMAVRALKDFDGVAILVTGGNVHPPDTPFNEALELKRHLVQTLGVPEDRVAIEPYGRHSTTNLRNAGRFMLAHGIERAVVVTSWLQSFYFGAADLSGFHARCRNELGYAVGTTAQVLPGHTSFVPSPDVSRRGNDPLDP